MEPRSRIKRTIYALLPFVLLLIIVSVINLISWWQAVQRMKVVTETAVATSVVVDVETAVSVHPTQPPTPTNSPPTATPHPTYPLTAHITLAGPPNNSILPDTESVSFYWTFPSLVYEGDYFSLFIINDTQEAHIATIFEPNLGSTYRITVSAEELRNATGQIQWLIRLKNDLETAPLRTSEVRTFTFLQTDDS